MYSMRGQAHCQILHKCYMRVPYICILATSLPHRTQTDWTPIYDSLVAAASLDTTCKLWHRHLSHGPTLLFGTHNKSCQRRPESGWRWNKHILLILVHDWPSCLCVEPSHLLHEGNVQHLYSTPKRSWEATRLPSKSQKVSYLLTFTFIEGHIYIIIMKINVWLFQKLFKHSPSRLLWR